MKPNSLLRLVNRINNLPMPLSMRQTALTWAFNSNIKYAGTTGIAIHKWNTVKTTDPNDAASNDSKAAESVVYLKNRWRVQNHIGGVHATAMATLAESATGMVFGLFVPDKTHVPLLKSMKINYRSRAIGNLTAYAYITQKQKDLIETTDRGAAVVEVKVTDQTNNEPIQCEMEWAWTTRQKTKNK